MYPTERNVISRSNESFRSKQDENHHRYESILEELDIDMVTSFPLDYMHVVLLGVLKRMMQSWLNGDLHLRLCSNDVTSISNALVLISTTQPTEFQRRSRSLSDFCHFKATEFRTLLLYTGPVAFKNVLSSDLYNHFLLLHVAISILCNNKICEAKSDVAKQMLFKFVEQTEELYGKEHITYNAHSLTHLSEDIKSLGSLNDSSCFPFESFNYKLKRLLRKHDTELAQIANRISEMNNVNTINTKTSKNFPLLTKRKFLDDSYTKFQTADYTIDSSLKNRWLLTPDKKILKFSCMKKINEEYLIWGSEIATKSDFYEFPIKSHKIDIFKTNKTESILQFWKHDLSSRKLFCIESSTEYIFFPLIHS